MSQIETSIGAPAASPSDSGATATPSAEYTPSSTQDTTSAPLGQSAGSATADAVQGQQTATPAPDDVLAGVPTLDELNQLSDDDRYKKSLVQMRTAIEKTFKPQVTELTERLSLYQPLEGQFEKQEDLQQLLDIKTKLFGYERDADSNQLIPSTQQFAELLNSGYQNHANFLFGDMAEQTMKHPETGQPIPRIDYWLECAAADPVERAKVLRAVGGVEPSAVAPTWQPSEAELIAFVGDPDSLTPEDKALQDVYRNLPYDERLELKLGSPEFIRRQLQKELSTQRIVEENRKGQELRSHEQARQVAYQQQQAQSAANDYLTQGFRTGMTEFVQSIGEKTKFIQPLDPQSPEAQQLGPQATTEWNTKAERVNKGVGLLVAITTAALSVPDTAWMAQAYLKELGVPDQVLASYDGARQEYANNARNYGELNYLITQGHAQEGAQPLGVLQSNARRAMGNMKGQGNAVAEPLLQLLSDFFELRATAHNSTLNSAASVRPPLNGNGFNPTTAPIQQPRDSADAWNPNRTIERFLPR